MKIGLVLVCSLFWVAGAIPSACTPPYDYFPFCQVDLSLEDRVDDIVNRLTFEEKINQTGNDAYPIPRLGIPAYQWWSEALHGVNSHCDSAGRCPTSFPSALALASSFNRDIWRRVGIAVSDEARVMYVEGTTEFLGSPYNNDVWAPNINIFRDPRWGRGQETPGEDPYLSGEYAAVYISNLQEGEDPRYFKVVATPKHFAAYSLESWNGMDRFHFDAIVSTQDLYQTFFPAFEKAVKLGKAHGIMCSYNSVNGIPSCLNTFLLVENLRQKWGFDGYVTSDCDAISTAKDGHHYVSTYEQATAMGIKAGTDVDCGGTYRDSIKNAHQQGLLNESDVDTIIKRLFSIRVRLGEFDPFDQPYNQIDPSIVNSPAHRLLAREAARESIILLKNRGLLPIDNSKSVTVAVIGPLSNLTADLCGNYYGDLPHVVSILEGITNVANVKVTFAYGCDVFCQSMDLFQQAINAAQSVDIAIVVLGLTGGIENEGLDRTSVSFPGYQLTLLQKIFQVQPSTVLVMNVGGSIDLSWPASNIPAIIQTHYPGEEGGNAVADVLFGRYNPSGRLPITVYPSSYNQTDYFSYDMRKYPGKTYRFLQQNPIYEFGYGLSYSSFSYKFAFEVDELKSRTDSITYSIIVANTGKYRSDISVLAFISKISNSVDTSLLENKPRTVHSNRKFTQKKLVDTDCPLAQLFGFEKINLWVGANSTLSFSVSLRDANCIDSSGNLVYKTGTYSVTIGDAVTYFVYSNRRKH